MGSKEERKKQFCRTEKEGTLQLNRGGDKKPIVRGAVSRTNPA